MTFSKLLASMAVLALTLGGVAQVADNCSVGISMYTLGAPYFAAKEAGARAAAGEAGCEVRMVTVEVNILIVNVRDTQGMVPAVNAASAAGIHVVAIDSTLDPSANSVILIKIFEYSKRDACWRLAGTRVGWVSLRVLHLFPEAKVTLSVVIADSAFYVDWSTL